MNEPKKLVLLGATGSIGTSTLRVIRKHPEKIKLVGISAHSKTEQLLRLQKNLRFHTHQLSIKHQKIILCLKIQNYFVDLNHSEDLATIEEADLVLVAVSGCSCSTSCSCCP